MNNLDLYNKVRSVPATAQKIIEAGRQKGKTDINPMWRIKVLTEQFGPCGVGWKTEVKRMWLERGANDEVAAFVEIALYVKLDGVDGEWSEAIPGLGGSLFIAKEKSGLYTDDDAYKKAYTDAISVACKALGIAADIYYSKDSTKYDKREQQPQTTDNKPPKPTGNVTYTPPPTQEEPQTRENQVLQLITGSSLTMTKVGEWIVKKYGKAMSVEQLTNIQFRELLTALSMAVAKERGDE